MREKFGHLAPFHQALFLFLIGIIAYVTISMISSLIIDALYPAFSSLSIASQLKDFPLLFMAVNYLPLQLGLMFVPGFIYLMISKKEASPFPHSSHRFLLIWAIVLFICAFLLLPFLFNLNGEILKIIGYYEELSKLKIKGDKQLALLIGSVNDNSFYGAILMIGIITGIAEELLFRRFLFHHIYKNTKKLFKSLIVSAFIFALLHFNYLQLLPLFIFGIILALMYYATKSIIPSIICHIANNSINIYWLATDSIPTWMEEMQLEITIPSTLLLMGLLIYFFRKKNV